MKSVNIRELKNRLSSYLRDVRTGEIILVTDRGMVVAELRPVQYHSGSVTTESAALDRLVSEGKVLLGLPNDAKVYRRSPLKMQAQSIDGLLDESRGD